jgi:hypothetical protein
MQTTTPLKEYGHVTYRLTVPHTIQLVYKWHPQTTGVNLALVADDTCLWQNARRAMFTENSSTGQIQWQPGVMCWNIKINEDKTWAISFSIRPQHGGLWTPFTAALTRSCRGERWHATRCAHQGRHNVSQHTEWGQLWKRYIEPCGKLNSIHGTIGHTVAARCPDYMLRLSRRLPCMLQHRKRWKGNPVPRGITGLTSSWGYLRASPPGWRRLKWDSKRWSGVLRDLDPSHCTGTAQKQL